MKVRLWRFAGIAAVVVSLASPAGAAIEKIAIPSEDGIVLFWWPKVAAPANWKHDREHSLHYGFNAFAPEGSSFADAETVMYARALYKPREPDLKSLEALITRDRESFSKRDPTMKIEAGPPLRSADGRELPSLLFKPQAAGNWERVAYLEEGEYYLLFVVSSRNAEGLANAQSAYEALVSSYRE